MITAHYAFKETDINAYTCLKGAYLRSVLDRKLSSDQKIIHTLHKNV